MTDAVGQKSSFWQCWQQLPDSIDTDSPLLIRAEDNAVTSYNVLTLMIEECTEQLVNTSSHDIITCVLENGPTWLAWFLAASRCKRRFIPIDPENHKDLPATAAALGAHWLVSVDGLTALQHEAESNANEWDIAKVSSGSTGDAKLVPCRASHLIADGEQIIRTMGIRSDDRNLAVIPFGFSYGLGNLIMPLLLQGTAIVYCQAYLPGQIPEWVQRYAITVMPTVPMLYQLLCQSTDKLDPRLRLCISAGATLSGAVAQSFAETHRRKIHNFYGSSETGGICYDRDGSAGLEGRSVGTPLEGVELTISPQGDITVRSQAVAKADNTWVLPDLGKLVRGELRLLGRKDRILNLSGKKLSAASIETCLRNHPEVTDALVFVRDEATRPRLCAAVETCLQRRTLQAYLHESLPAWQVPSQFFVTNKLPRDARGKLTPDAVISQLSPS